MARSTASFIAYDVRPSKQIERRAIVEYLNCAKHAGFNIPQYRYVGLGGTKFIDFHLMRRFVGFSSYASIERDEDIFPRCKFNCPFEFIQMYPGEFSQFLISDQYEGNSAYWMDLEGCISVDTLSDMNSMANHINEGDMLFVTICAELPSGMNNKSTTERRGVLRSKIPTFSSSINRMKNDAFSEKSFRKTAGEMLLLMLDSAFSSRTDGAFQPLLRVLYRDSSWMCTIGGSFTSKRSRRASRLKRLVGENLSPVCGLKKDEFYSIPEFNFTNLERILIEKSDLESMNAYTRRLLSLRLEKDKLLEYKNLARLVPRYVESAF